MPHPSSIRTAWPLLCLAALATSCASVPEPETVVVTEVQIERIRPPASLMRPCPVPEMSGATLGDVVELAIRRGQALVECNDRLSAIRRSVTEQPEQTP